MPSTYTPDSGPWTNDKKVETLLGAAPVLAWGDVDLRPFCTDSDQLTLGACAGNSSTDSVEIVSRCAEAELAAQEGRAPREVPELSRLFTYAMARTLDGELSADQGTYLRLCFQSLSDFGICTEKEWPYDPRQVYVSPSIIAQRKAKGRHIHGAYRITNEGQARLDDIVAALRRHKPVCFGTQVNGALQAYNGRDVMRPPQGGETDGHAMVVVGYLKGLFLVKNSWGKDWGDRGFAWFSPDYLAWSDTTDLWVPTMGYELGRK